MAAIIERQFTVRHYECDPGGEMNPAVYLRFMQESAYAASAEVGYNMVSYAKTKRAWFVRDTEIEFIAPVKYGDSVTLHTRE